MPLSEENVWEILECKAVQVNKICSNPDSSFELFMITDTSPSLCYSNLSLINQTTNATIKFSKLLKSNQNQTETQHSSFTIVNAKWYVSVVTTAKLVLSRNQVEQKVNTSQRGDKKNDVLLHEMLLTSKNMQWLNKRQ